MTNSDARKVARPISRIFGQPEVAAGWNDVRAGRERFDDFPTEWQGQRYAIGRQAAILAAQAMGREPRQLPRQTSGKSLVNALGRDVAVNAWLGAIF